MRGTGDRGRKESCHQDRNRDDPHHYGTQGGDARQSSRGNSQPREKEHMYVKELCSDYSHPRENIESPPSRVRSYDHQPKHHLNYDVSNDDKMPFSDYIMSVKLPRGFKPSIDMEPYDGSFDPQEHMDAFKSRTALAGASDLVKCRASPIMLKKAALKWFNSLPLRSIGKFSNLQSLF